MNCIYCQSPLTMMAKSYHRNTCDCPYQHIGLSFSDMLIQVNGIEYQIIFSTYKSTLFPPGVSSQNKEIVSQIIPKEISLPALQSTILRILKLNNFK